MARAAADTSGDWLLPEGARPPTIAELEERIELALATARASEAAVMTVGAAALDAAEQAKRAAELAERASFTAFPPRAGARPPAGSGDGSSSDSTPGPERGDRALDDFSERASRLAVRLRRLQRVPLGVPIASDAAAR